jgi:hypothetical protein
LARKSDIDFETQHPIHDSVFGDDPHGLLTDTEQDGYDNFRMHGTSVQPEGFQPMLSTGETDQHRRQPDGGRQR